MILDVEFEELNSEFEADFGEVYRMTDDKTYDDGYKDAQEKFGMEKSVTGTNIVNCNYANENEHSVNVRLSSDTISDYKGLVVKKIHENILNTSALLDGYIKSNGTVDSVTWCKCTDYIPVPPNSTLILWNTCPTSSTLRHVATYDAEKKFISSLGMQGIDTEKPCLYKIGSDVCYVRFTVLASVIETAMATINFCPNEYVSYQEEIFDVESDGTVEIPSYSPSMNIICDIDGVNLNAEYIQMPTAHWNEYWDTKQQYGNRQKYDYAFCYEIFSAEQLCPKYDIIPSDVTCLFGYSTIDTPIIMSEWEEQHGIVFDTSYCSNFNQTFRDTNIFREINVLDVSGANNTNASIVLTVTFFENTTLQRINRFICGKKTPFAITTFNGCTALEYIGFEGEITSANLNLHWSTLLNKECIQKLFNTLSTTTTGVSITLSKTAVANAFKTATGLADGVTSDEWLALVASRSNWTINLI